MRISAKADYALRAALELAAAGDDPVKASVSPRRRHPPPLSRAHPPRAQSTLDWCAQRRGARGGYWLAKPAEEITVADVIRAVEGPLANIHESAPEDLHYDGAAERLSRRVGRRPREPAGGPREHHARRRGLEAAALAARGAVVGSRGLDQALNDSVRRRTDTIRRLPLPSNPIGKPQKPHDAPMQPEVIVLGLLIGTLVGMTGMGGASLMTPLLILVVGTAPVTAIGTDIFYGAITKTVGGWQHLKKYTVHLGLVVWLAVAASRPRWPGSR